jgi:Flp pilus assembly protein TadG
MTWEVPQRPHGGVKSGPSPWRIAGTYDTTCQQTSASRLAPDRRRAQALVEFAVVLSMLAILLVGAVDFARVFYFDVLVSAAALEGALAAAAGAPDDQVLVAARETAPTAVASVLTVAISPPAAQRTTGLAPVWTTVAASYTFAPVTPLARSLIRESITLTRSVSQQMRTPCVLSNGMPC